MTASTSLLASRSFSFFPPLTRVGTVSCVVLVGGAGCVSKECQIARKTGLGDVQFPGSKSWSLERLRRENVKKFEGHGRKVVIGGGMALGWIAAPRLAVPVGRAAGAGLGAAGFLGSPIWAVNSKVRVGGVAFPVGPNPRMLKAYWKSSDSERETQLALDGSRGLRQLACSLGGWACGK